MDEYDTAVRNLGACARGDWSRDLADAKADALLDALGQRGERRDTAGVRGGL